MGIIITEQPVLNPIQATIQAKRKSTNIYNALEKQHTELFNFIWKNKDVTVEQFMEQYGTDAAALFAISSKIQEVLALTNPNYVPLTPLKEVTLNQDGTVTIGAAI